jgi:hypothetical protein
MASTIDATKPVSGNPTTQSVRDNFSAAKTEIEALQTTTAANTAAVALKAPINNAGFTGTTTIPTASITSLTFNGVALTVTGTQLNGFDARITANTNAIAALDLTPYATKASPAFTGTISYNGTGITSTAAELNQLDGFLGTVDDLNYAKDLRATGVTTTEFDKLDGLTATTTELNYNDITTLGTVQANKTVTAAASAINFNNFDMTNVDINSGAIDGVTIGAAAAGAITGTTVTGTTVNASSTLQVGGSALTTGFTRFWEGTQAAYDAIGTKDANTIYFITA